MALSTANTLLKYGISQVETATVVGTITGAGNAKVTVTGAGITGSPLAVTFAVALNDAPFTVAEKAVVALNNTAAISALYLAIQNGASIILRRKVAAANDATLNMAIANDTCTGLTAAPTSTDTTSGVALASLVPILSYPDMGSAPSKLETTDLSQLTMKTNILGLQEAPDLTFECNYDESAFNTIIGLTGTYCFQLQFGTSDGAFTWMGQINVFATGGGVDEVRKMTVVISVATAIVFSTT